jgi:hypothetical protein
VTLQAWNGLSLSDQEYFSSLRAKLLKKTSVPIPMTFRNEFQLIMSFIGNAPGREDRAKVAGAAAAGPFIAVNTRQLKNLIGRASRASTTDYRRTDTSP